MSDVLGGYELLDLIGRGASGRVWRARQIDGGSVVAVKVLHEDLADDPEVRGRFEAEARWLTGNSLPGVVTVHEVVFDRERLALVMDLIDGVDLRRLMNERGPLAAGETCRIAAQVATGLASAHTAGIIHRDVKPENVLVQPGEDGPGAWITDFGVARLMDGPTRTRASRIVGTTDYVAPEVLGGQSATGAVDVYALGILVFEALMGWRPFRGEHAAAVMQQHLHAPLIRPDGFPDPLWSLLERCLSRGPDDRPSADEMAAELTSLATELDDLPPMPGTATPPPVPIDSVNVMPTEIRGQRRPNGGREETEPEGGRRLRPMLVGVVAAVLLLLGASGIAFALQGGEDEAAASSSDAVSASADAAASSAAEASAAAQQSAAQESAAQQSAALESAAQQSAAEASAAAQQSSAEAAAQQSAAEAAAAQQAAAEAAAQQSAAQESAAQESATQESAAAEEEAAAQQEPPQQEPAQQDAAAAEAPAVQAPAAQAPAAQAPAAQAPAAQAPVQAAPKNTAPAPPNLINPPVGPTVGRGSCAGSLVGEHNHKVNGTVVASTLIYYNSANGNNCAVLRKRIDVGVKSYVGLTLCNAERKCATDRDYYEDYAGPVTVYGKNMCITFAISMLKPDRTAWVLSPQESDPSHCK